MSNILVTGASGIVGYGILKSLRKAGFDLKLIASTIYDDSVAQGFCDVFELAPPTNEDGYVDWLLGVIRRNKIDLIIPGIEADMYSWVEHLSIIESAGAKALLNNPDLISICKDKWQFFQSLRQYGLPCIIESTLEADFEALAENFGLPFLLKPRRGFGSKGIVRIKSKEDFRQVEKSIGDILMAQPIVGNEEEEYTTSAFCDGKGGFFSHFTLRRTLAKEGFTEKAEVCELEGLEKILGDLCNIFKPVGPTNFQFRTHRGILKLLEINPRISSSTSIRTAFGYNECGMAIDFFLNGKVPDAPLIRRGRAVRYMEDFVFYENRNHF